MIVKTVMLTYPQTLHSTELSTLPQVLAIGQFDGLHLGHASVILSAVRIARETGMQAAGHDLSSTSEGSYAQRGLRGLFNSLER